MRPSSRHLILEAATRVTEREGITGLTLESTAEEAGLTKGGLLYHFRTREDLILAIQRHLVDGWEERLLAELGKPYDDADPTERGAAYARVIARGSKRQADLAFMLESVSQPELTRIWNELMERWAPTPSSPEPAGLDLFLARLIADGLWLHKSTAGCRIPPDVERAVLARVTGLTGAPPPDTSAPRGEAVPQDSPQDSPQGRTAPRTKGEGS
ncbi:TetR/AcrR family transcriptional regulator [Nocardiopsis oceani]